jgi:hypothetical protein
MATRVGTNLGRYEIDARGLLRGGQRSSGRRKLPDADHTARSFSEHNPGPTAARSLFSRKVNAQDDQVRISWGLLTTSSRRHFSPPLGLMIIVGRHLSDQERKLVGYVDAHKEFLDYIGAAIGIGENNIQHVARTA